MYKYGASLAGDYAATGISNAVLDSATKDIQPLNSLLGGANIIGGAVGMFQTPKDPDKTLKQLNQGSAAKSIIPGVGRYNLGLRRSAVAAKVGADKTKLFSQKLGPITSLLLLTALGGLTGAAIGTSSKDDPFATNRGAAIGAGVGALGGGIASIIGAIRAAATPKRTWAQQKQYQESSPQTWKNYLIPGVGTYNYYKSLGRSHE